MSARAPQDGAPPPPLAERALAGDRNAQNEVIARAAVEEIADLREILGLPKGQSLQAAVRTLVQFRDDILLARGMEVAQRAYEEHFAAAIRAAALRSEAAPREEEP